MSVGEAARVIRQAHSRIHVLVNNAAVMFHPFELTGLFRSLLSRLFFSFRGRL